MCEVSKRVDNIWAKFTLLSCMRKMKNGSIYRVNCLVVVTFEALYTGFNSSKYVDNITENPSPLHRRRFFVISGCLRDMNQRLVSKRSDVIRMRWYKLICHTELSCRSLQFLSIFYLSGKINALEIGYKRYLIVANHIASSNQNRRYKVSAVELIIHPT